MRVGANKKFVTDTVLQQQKVTGKPMTDDDVIKHIDGLFARSVSFRTAFMGFDTGGGSARLMTMRANDIPDDTLAALKGDFRAAGIASPSEADLLGAYFRLKSMSPKPAAGQSASGKIKPMK